MLGEVKLVTPDPPDITLPPEAAAYQSMVSPAPAEAESVTVPVPHLAPPTGAVGSAGTAFIVAVTAVRVVELQPVAVFLASAKYCVVTLMEGVVKLLLPESTSVPPDAASYQSMV